MPGEPAGVSHRVRLPVVVEVGVHLDAGAPARDPPLPLLELALGVVAAAPATSVVETDVGPIRGQLVGADSTPGVVGDHQRGVVAAEQVVDVVDEPARVAELERVAGSRYRT